MGNQKQASAIRNLRNRSKLKKVKSRANFWRQTSLGELIKDQGIKPMISWEQILGKGSKLWESDQDFEKFLSGIYQRRKNEIR